MRNRRQPPVWSRLRCLRTMRVLQNYLDGHLDDRAAERIADHLDACRRCGLEASIYAAIKTALRDRQDPLDGRLLERLRDFGDQLASGGEARAGDRDG